MLPGIWLKDLGIDDLDRRNGSVERVTLADLRCVARQCAA